MKTTDIIKLTIIVIALSFVACSSPQLSEPVLTIEQQIERGIIVDRPPPAPILDSVTVTVGHGD